MRNGLLVTGFLVLVASDTLLAVSFKMAGAIASPVAFGLPWVGRLLSTGWVYIAIGCYLFNFGVWMSLLKSAPIGPAFAATHLELVGVMLVSYFVFGHVISTAEFAGAMLIVAGIICLALDHREGDTAASAVSELVVDS